MKNLRPFLLRGLPFSLAVVSGILFALALPPYNFEVLGWMALVPLLFAASRTPRALWAFGLGATSGGAAGAFYVGFRGAGTSLDYAYVPFIWMAAVFGLTALFASVMRARGWRGVPFVVGVACAGVAAEWLTFLTPLPVNFALTQYQNWFILQPASVVGIWGVSFLLYVTNAAIADYVLRACSEAETKARDENRYRVLCFPVTLIVLTFLLLGLLENSNSGVATLQVAAIQDYSGTEAQGKDPYAPPPKDDLPDSAALIRQSQNLSRTPSPELKTVGPAELIVGAENAYGYAFTPNNPNSEANRLAWETGRYLVVGHEMNVKGVPRPYNCASLISPQGKTLATHHKIALFLGERQTMQAGTRATVADTPLGKIGMLICFDTCYTAPTRDAVRQGAQLIAVPNFDPPTPRATLHYLHAAVMPFRAVENHVAIIRADPNGKSQIISPSGAILGEAAMYEAIALVRGVPLGDGKGTLYTHFGDWFAYLCLAVTLAFSLSKRTKNTTWVAGNRG